MKALVVGQAPSQDTDGHRPFTGRSGANLASLLGVRHERLPQEVDLVNLLQRWPGKAPNGQKGDRFPMVEARAAAAMLLAIAPHDRLIACGAPVAAALGVRGDPLERVTRGSRTILLLPHPSGVNRWYNEPSNVSAAAAALRAFIHPDLWAVG